MWFNKRDPRTLFVDKRCESFRPTGSKFANRDVEVAPDIQADFKRLPFPDEAFSMVVFDPPHIIRKELRGNVTKYYGALPEDWMSELRQGFRECFRVLKPDGTLIFKWCESQIPLTKILELTPHKPLFGHRSGKAARTHWCAFIKPAVVSSDKCDGCGQKIDSDTCCCGEMMVNHNPYFDNHAPTPMGCRCGYSRSEGPRS